MISDGQYERHRDAVIFAIGEWGIPQHEFKDYFRIGSYLPYRVARAVVTRMLLEGSVYKDCGDNDSFNLTDKGRYYDLENEDEEDEDENLEYPRWATV